MRFLLFLVFMCIHWVHGYSFRAPFDNSLPKNDTLPSIRNIPLLWLEDEFVSRYCGQKATEAICTINDLYKDLGYLFSLTPYEENSPVPKATSFLNFAVIENQCLVQFDIHKIETFIQDSSSIPWQVQTRKPSSLQMNVLKPYDNSVAYFRKLNFEWESTDQANQYLLELSLDMNFEIPYLSSIVFGTKCTIEDLPADRMIYWRIKPLNFLHYCEESRASGKTYSSKTFVHPFSCQSVSVYSLAPPRSKSIFIHNPENLPYNLKVEAMDESVMISVGTNATQKIIDVSGYLPGAYFVYLNVGQNKNYSTLIIE